MKSFLRLLSAFLLVVFFTADASANVPKILLVKDIKPGTLAIGFSVFRGIEPEPFDVVLGGTISQMGNSFILARISGGPMDTPLEKIGAISGMSGSPIFVDCTDLEDCVSNGTLVGALSYSVGSFIEGGMNCLLTPAEYMLGARVGGYLAAAEFSSRMTDKIYVQGKEFSNLMIFPEIGSLGVQSPTSGKCVESATGELKAGSMVTVFLAKGMIPFGSSGTVTWRDGNEIYIFGHPFMGTGLIDYPFVHVTVADTIQTPAKAFKLPGCSLNTEGSMVLDGAFEMVGIIGRTAPVIPMRVELHLNEGGAVFEEEVVPSPLAERVIGELPVVWAQQNLGNLNHTSIAYQVRIAIQNEPEVFIKNIIPEQAGKNPLERLFEKVTFVTDKLNQEMPDYGIGRINVHVDFIKDLKIWIKKTAFLSQDTAAPGETVYANIILQEFNSGLIQQISIPIKVPADFMERVGLTTPSVVALPLNVLIQSGDKFTDKRNLTENVLAEDLIRQLNRTMNYRTDVLYTQQVMLRLKSGQDDDEANAKKSVKPAWTWTIIGEGDLRQFPAGSKTEVVLTVSPAIGGFIDFDETFSLRVQEETLTEENEGKKEIKKRRWFDFFKK